MKKPLKSFLRLTALMAIGPAFFASSAAAQIILGDTFAINFTESETTVGGNWNEVVLPLDETNALRDLVLDLNTLADGRATGVSLSLTAPANSFGLGARSEPALGTREFPHSGVIPDNAQRRLTFHTTVGQEFVFSGLDDNLSYDLSILSANLGPDRNAHNWIANPGQVDEITISVNPNDGLVHTFSNLLAHGGTIVLRSGAPSGGGIDGQHINAIELTAIPEPAVFATIAGVLALGLVIYRRRLR